MAAPVKFEKFVEHLAEKIHDLGADTISMQFMNTTPDAANDEVETDLPVDLATGGGYTQTTGVSLGTATTSAQTGGVYTFDLADNVFTASGASVGPFRYVPLFNSTSAGKELILFYDHGTSITLLDTETFTITFNAGGVFTIT